MAANESSKLSKVKRRGYAIMVDVDILTRYFSLPKVEDIIMVYNGTYNGLNTLLCDPRFPLPIVGSNICAVEKGTYMTGCGIR